MKRDWSDATAKVQQEGRCRLHALHECDGPLQAAHVIGRRYDKPAVPLTVRAAVALAPPLIVRAVDTVPLCRRHHHAYDARQLDILPYLTLQEQAAAVEHVGIVRALARTTSGVATR